MKVHKKIKEKIKNHDLYKKAVENRYLAIFILMFIALTTYSYFTEGIVYSIANQNLDETTKFINSFGGLAWLFYILAMIIEVLIVPIPSLVLIS